MNDVRPPGTHESAGRLSTAFRRAPRRPARQAFEQGDGPGQHRVSADSAPGCPRAGSAPVPHRDARPRRRAALRSGHPRRPARFRRATPWRCQPPAICEPTLFRSLTRIIHWRVLTNCGAAWPAPAMPRVQARCAPGGHRNKPLRAARCPATCRCRSVNPGPRPAFRPARDVAAASRPRRF
jgi:hypothetical protein